MVFLIFIPFYNNNTNTSDLENNIKEFINTQKVFNATIEEKLNKIDDISRSIDRISHDLENLKMKFFVPKVEESSKALYVSMDESKKGTAMLRAKREFLEKRFLVIAFIKVMKILKWLVFLLLILCLINLILIKMGL